MSDACCFLQLPLQHRYVVESTGIIQFPLRKHDHVAQGDALHKDCLHKLKCEHIDGK